MDTYCLLHMVAAGSIFIVDFRGSLVMSERAEGE